MSELHTPGTIRYDYEPGYCGELIASNDTSVASFVEEPSEADARRLVACWNACDGMDTDLLECLRWYGPTDLLAQRDELLGALQKATDALAGGLWDYGPGQDEHDQCNQVVDECRAAIAKATGGEV